MTGARPALRATGRMPLGFDDAGIRPATEPHQRCRVVSAGPTEVSPASASRPAPRRLQPCPVCNLAYQASAPVTERSV